MSFVNPNIEKKEEENLALSFEEDKEKKEEGKKEEGKMEGEKIAWTEDDLPSYDSTSESLRDILRLLTSFDARLSTLENQQKSILALLKQSKPGVSADSVSPVVPSVAPVQDVSSSGFAAWKPSLQPLTPSPAQSQIKTNSVNNSTSNTNGSVHTSNTHSFDPFAVSDDAPLYPSTSNGPTYHVPSSSNGPTYHVPSSSNGPTYHAPSSSNGPAYHAPSSSTGPVVSSYQAPAAQDRQRQEAEDAALAARLQQELNSDSEDEAPRLGRARDAPSRSYSYMSDMQPPSSPIATAVATETHRSCPVCQLRVASDLLELHVNEHFEAADEAGRSRRFSAPPARTTSESTGNTGSGGDQKKGFFARVFGGNKPAASSGEAPPVYNGGYPGAGDSGGSGGGGAAPPVYNNTNSAFSRQATSYYPQAYPRN